jgi:hypothetical protein
LKQGQPESRPSARKNLYQAFMHHARTFYAAAFTGSRLLDGSWLGTLHDYSCCAVGTHHQQLRVQFLQERIDLLLQLRVTQVYILWHCWFIHLGGAQCKQSPVPVLVWRVLAL